MVRHVILWQLKDEISGSEKEIVKKGIKEGLEGLKGKIEGLVEIKVNESPLPSSNADVMLDSLFESADALKNYSTHPAHVEVANGKVRPYTKARTCMDFEV
ncbi:MAG: Dabb family protein [Treponema sp.]|nr:Dabb family protein [Treponema sp.]